MQNWDDILYPSFRATIRGEYYGIITQDDIDEECFFLAERAVAAFKFPHISTDYTIFYAIRDADNSLEVVDANTEGAIPHAYFNNELTYAEIEIIIAWMKVYWAENQISNADNFDDMYTDVNIKTYSRANMLDKATNLYKTYRENARELENRYSRVSVKKTPSMGDINEDDDNE